MKNLKSLLAIFCTALLSLAFCGEALASSTTIHADKKKTEKSKHKNSASATSGGVSLSTGNDTKAEHKPALPDGLNGSTKYEVKKFEVESGDTLQLTLSNNKTYKCIIFGVEVPKTWDSWQTELSEKKLKEMLTGKVQAQVCNGIAKSKTRIGGTSSSSVSGSGGGTTATSESNTSKTLLVKVFVKNTQDVGKLMIDQGYATCYQAEIGTTGMGVDVYARVQARAQKEKKGCWGDPQ